MSDVSVASARQVNREYYREVSPGRSDYWRKMAAPRARVSSFLNFLKKNNPSSVLDLGCGSGELLREVQSSFPGVRLSGVDLSPVQVNENRAVMPEIEWTASDLDERADFPENFLGAFDCVSALEIIEHVERPEVFLENALALARPGKGLLFLSTQSGRIFETEGRVGHRRHFSADEIKNLLLRAGWNPLQVWNEGLPFHNLSKVMANIFPDRTMKGFSASSYGLFQNSVCILLRLAYRLNLRTVGSQLFAVARSLRG